MLTWLSQNLAATAVSAVLIAIVVLIIVKLVRDRRAGKSSCGCNCSTCAMHGSCHKKYGFPPKRGEPDNPARLFYFFTVNIGMFCKSSITQELQPTYPPGLNRSLQR